MFQKGEFRINRSILSTGLTICRVTNQSFRSTSSQDDSSLLEHFKRFINMDEINAAGSNVPVAAVWQTYQIEVILLWRGELRRTAHLRWQSLKGEAPK
jgi:hypothetical protein